MNARLKVVLILLFIALLLGLMIAVALYVPNSLLIYSDFLAIYDADQRLLQHLSPYDYQGQIQQLAIQAGTVPQNIYVPQFPYPPWYSLGTVYLGLMPIQSAAMLWFEINLVMLFLTVWFLSADWHPRLRLFSLLAPFLFIPVIGTLGVGQYDFPVLLGGAFLTHAIRHERPALTSIGTALLTFKPHVGVPILLGVLIYFIFSRDPFRRRALVWIFGGFAFLCVMSLIADPLWMINYPRSFATYQTGTDIATCNVCDSLPSWLATRFISNPTLLQMTLIGSILFVALVSIFGSLRSRLLQSSSHLLTVSILIVLLTIPHLFNYDFVLLLIPFAVLAEESRSWIERISLIVLYVIPFIAIPVLGRSAGDPSLLAVTLILAALTYRHVLQSPRLDVSRRAA